MQHSCFYVLDYAVAAGPLLWISCMESHHNTDHYVLSCQLDRSCLGKNQESSIINLFAMQLTRIITYCHVNLVGLAFTETKKAPLLRFLSWWLTLIITYCHVNLVGLAFTETKKAPSLRILPWWLTLIIYTLTWSFMLAQNLIMQKSISQFNHTAQQIFTVFF